MDWFTKTFTFSRDELQGYIKGHPGLIPYLLNSSMDQRGGFYSVFDETPNGYAVGFYDRRRQKTRLFDNPIDAATEYVFLFWRMILLEE